MQQSPEPGALVAGGAEPANVGVQSHEEPGPAAAHDRHRVDARIPPALKPTNELADSWKAFWRGFRGLSPFKIDELGGLLGGVLAPFPRAPYG